MIYRFINFFVGVTSDKQLLEQEELVFTHAQSVEAVFALEKRKQLPPGVELCFTSPVETMLKEPGLYHLYFKYFYHLQVSTTTVTFYSNLYFNKTKFNGGAEPQLSGNSI